MYIHRGSRRQSERSPHAQMKLHLWDLVAPAMVGKKLKLIKVSFTYSIIQECTLILKCDSVFL